MTPNPLVYLIGILLALSPVSNGISLDISDATSIRDAAATIAYGLMKYYTNNATDTPIDKIGLLPYPPYYWWESGAMWGGLIDYYFYTSDSSYNAATLQGMIANVGPAKDYIVPEHTFDEGNDDQAFWGLALMSALENRYPDPPSDQPQWLALAKNLFDNQASRWDTSTCSGGLRWQIYPQNAYGYFYKNSVSNGAFFQMAARLARYTGDQKYVDWAVRAWDWTKSVGLISDNFDVYDGADTKINCKALDHTQWSYNVALFLEGAAALYSMSSAELWMQRTVGLLDASTVFFYQNTNIMYEPACELTNNCDTDQQSFKAYLSRWLAKTSVLAPFTQPSIQPLLEASAQAAAAACSGGQDGVTCGTKWYGSKYDGTWGAGQQLAALEVVQALLIVDAEIPYSPYMNPGTNRTNSAIIPRNATTASASYTAAFATGTGSLNPLFPEPKTYSDEASGAAVFLASKNFSFILVASLVCLFAILIPEQRTFGMLLKL